MCVARQIGIRLSLTLVFAALLIKSIQVTFSAVHRSHKGRKLVIKPSQRVVLVLLIVAGQMVLVIISLIIAHPGVDNQLTFSSGDEITPNIALSCSTPNSAMLISMMLYDFLLIILFNGFAIATVRFAYNCNETRYIAIASITIALIWLVYIHVYYATSDNSLFQVGATVMEIMLVAFSVIFCLLLPRLYSTFSKQNSKLSRVHFQMANSHTDEDNVSAFSQAHIQNEDGREIDEDGLKAKLEPLIADDEK